jgi:4-carboxymuconolactone decarboxylase
MGENDDFRRLGASVAQELWGRERAERVASAADANTTDAFYDMGLMAWSIFKRPGLDLKTRLLITIAVDATGGWTGPLKHHIYAALNVGVERAQILETLTQIAPYVGLPPVNQAFGIARECFENHRPSSG